MTEHLRIRPRRDDDLPVLAEILERQQPVSHYPLQWPLPYPTDRFIRRRSELAAWVAELDERVAGHVALHAAEDDELGRLWSRAQRLPVSSLRCVGVLYVDSALARRGVGSALLTTATDHALAHGGAPVLDVVAERAGPIELYRRHGWREIGRFRPDWLPAEAAPVVVMILPRPGGTEVSSTRAAS